MHHKFLMLSPTVIVLLILCSDQFQISLAYKYEFGDGSYYVGSRDAQGRPNGPGRFHNSSGDLGKRLLSILSDRKKYPLLVFSDRYLWVPFFRIFIFREKRKKFQM